MQHPVRGISIAAVAGLLVLAGGSNAQLPNIPMRGTEDSGRNYIGEPVEPFIGHLTMLFTTGKYPTPGAGTMQDAIDWINNPLHSCVADGTGGLAVYAHPDAADRVLVVNRLTGMDVFHEDEIPSAYPYRDQMWDAVNSTLDAQGKPLLWGFAADDSHSTQTGAFNYAWNMELVPSADVYSIKTALRNGAFYPTNGPRVSAVSVSGTRITLTASQPSTVQWLRAGQYDIGSPFVQTTATGAGHAVRIDVGVTSSTLDVAQLGLAFADVHFVRAIVRTSATAVALTQPFRVSAGGGVANPYPAGGLWVAGQSHNHDDAWIGAGSARLTTFRSNYLAVGQQAPFETAYSYWEYPFQGLDSDGYPDIAAVSPAKVAYASQPRITVTGVNFSNGLTVQAGEYALSDVTVVAPTQLTATVPLSVPPGTYDVVVTAPNLLRGTAAGALFIQDPAADNTGWASYRSPDLPWNQATSIAAVGADIWVGTMHGAARYSGGAWTSVVPAGGQNVWSQGIYDVIADPGGGVWLSSEGMWFQDAAGTLPWSYARPTNGATSERWGRMAFDGSGRLWVTSRWGEGLAIHSASGAWTRWTRASNGLPLDDDQTIARDSQGNMWVGFGGGYGVWKWTGSAWQQVVMPAPLNHVPDPLVIAAGRNGDMWVAASPRNISYTPAQSGVARFRSDGSYEVYQSPPLPQPRVTAIVAARNGDVWFASRAGVARLDALGEWKTFTAGNSGLVSDIVTAMTEDASGRIWFATADGVSSYAPVVAPPSVPAAPTRLAATATSASQIALSWTDNSADESGFRIERSANGGSFVEIATVPANVVSYVSGGLTSGTTYVYRVRAFNGAGASDYSNVASATTLLATPAAPTSLTVTALSGARVALAWTDHATNESGFQIERAVGSGSFSLLAVVGTNVTTYVDTGLPRTTYRYRVRAYNSVGVSAYTNIATIKTKPK